MSTSRDGLPGSGQDLAQVLAGLLRLKGMALLEERQRRRLHGLLRDYAPGSVRDIRLLLLALESGAAGRIQRMPAASAAEAFSAEADGMVDRFGCDRRLALGAIAIWAAAFASLRGEIAVLPPAPPSPGAGGNAEGGAGWFARFGGIAFAVLLVLVALAHGLGLF